MTYQEDNTMQTEVRDVQRLQEQLAALMSLVPPINSEHSIAVRRSLAFIVDALTDENVALLQDELLKFAGRTKEIDLLLAEVGKILLKQKYPDQAKFLLLSYAALQDRAKNDPSARLMPPPILEDMVPEWYGKQAID